MKTLPRIYLINAGDSVVWCDTPKPMPSIKNEDVQEYVRSDLHDEVVQQLANVREENRTLLADRAFKASVGCADCPPLQKLVQRLRITGCTDGMRWYASLIGQTVPFLGDVGNEYKSREPDGFVNFVQYSDAEIVDFSMGAPCND